MQPRRDERGLLAGATGGAVCREIARDADEDVFALRVAVFSPGAALIHAGFQHRAVRALALERQNAPAGHVRRIGIS